MPWAAPRIDAMGAPSEAALEVAALFVESTENLDVSTPASFDFDKGTKCEECCF